MRLTNRREFLTNLGCFSGVFALLGYFTAGELIQRPQRTGTDTKDVKCTDPLCHTCYGPWPRFAIGESVIAPDWSGRGPQFIRVRLLNVDDKTFEYLISPDQETDCDRVPEDVLEPSR